MEDPEQIQANKESIRNIYEHLAILNTTSSQSNALEAALKTLEGLVRKCPSIEITIKAKR